MPSDHGASLDKNKLQELRTRPLDHSYKGIPLGEVTTLDDIASRGWNVAAGDLALPVTTLSRSALESNVRTMAAYCRRNGALLAPHGKTSMSPQLVQRQMEAGAWGMTVATPTQAAVMRDFGVNRIIMANELTEPRALSWAARGMRADPQFDFYCLVDSAATVALMSTTLQAIPGDRPMPVFLEVGLHGGRGGVRNLADAVSVAEAVHGTPQLRLAGVEAYEGLVTSGDAPEDIAAVDDFFAYMHGVVEELARLQLFEADPVIVTAGGSSYFDRVVAGLGEWTEAAPPVRLLLRSGCYITHDAGKYERLSPLAGRRPEGETLRLINGLTGWASVLSRPEGGLAILGTGKRDIPYDVSLPVPRLLHKPDGATLALEGRADIVKAMDQHTFMRLCGDISIDPGDIVSLDLSHPCTAFDKTKFVPIVDEEHTVVDGLLTFF